MLAATPQLAQLDLGYGDDSMTRYFWDYCVSDGAMRRLQRAHRRVCVTMSGERDPLPPPWAGGEREEAGAVGRAICALAEDGDEGIRANARKALRGEADDGEEDDGEENDDDDDEEEGNWETDDDDDDGA